jgi:hypothetical protein
VVAVTARGRTTKWSVIKARKGRPTIIAAAERDGRYWLIRIDGRPELFTQAVRLDLAEEMVRDLVATYDHVDRDSFDVRVRPKLPEDVEEALDALDHVRTLESIGVAISRALAVELVRTEGLSLRDAGRILQLSHQRIGQLLAEHDAWGGDRRPGFASYVEELDAWSNRNAVIRVSVDADPVKNAEAIKRLKERIAAEDAGGAAEQLPTTQDPEG